MDTRALISAVREGETPAAEALAAFAIGLADGAVTDAQAGAFAMAVCLRGLSEEGRVALTLGMRDSGGTLAWDLPGPVVDKHSTGGVGDCVSLVLAPALAACGVYVPMISGRGLGHTGGTLDKMEAIPGVDTQVSEAKLRKIVGEVGCAIVGANRDIAPADKRLYAIRDVTSTVASVDLITASILSKKLAAGLEALILDVKFGAGAFMKSIDEARALAEALVGTAKGADCAAAAFISDMDQPVAPSIGNAVEVATCMEVLSGDAAAAPRLHALSVQLGGRVLALAGVAEGEAKISEVIASGAAMARFSAMVRAMGGPPDMGEDWRSHLPKAPVVGDVLAPRAGFVASIDGEALGLAAVALGGGRRVETDRIDPRVGLTEVAELGAPIERGQPLAVVHAATEQAATEAADTIVRAIAVSDTAPQSGPLVREKIG